MITKEEFEEAVNCCTGFTVSCENCPLSEKDFKCGVYLAEYLKENEPALSANSTSSEVSKDTSSTHLNDSILLDICQEGLCTVAQTRNADYQIGYADAVLDAIKKLRGEQSD
ncbi:MAG: hypothetical protein KH227_10430 [Ruminococcus bicirculans]|uniref:hypothetical protein n=1 Tax=Ruminococcus bicirculans (ex Wegman et al. 2014) TaxID=1160721 RepID=UPI00242B552B|nr:hypothetical protein [Ruminococcus bicirculans (ex Wegman et al. 2014)]MBS6819580.1 hypothetical protein [Ruminococcus bicirculans (ex Wegman et al. 2014)]